MPARASLKWTFHPRSSPTLVSLRTDLFDFEVPPHLVAQRPAARRDESRLLVVDRKQRRWEHRVFSDLPEYTRPGDVLFRNNAAVLPARLHAQRPTGGAVECFLLRNELCRGPNHWWCLIKPGRRLPVGSTFARDQNFRAEVVEKTAEGTALVRFSTPRGIPIEEVAAKLGEVPLPPYIERAGTPEERSLDVERYQTVYASSAKRVAVAAPTAGLHFTPELLARLVRQGIETADVTLHVGLGTFKPISTEFVSEHVIHRELYEMPAATQLLLRSVQGRRIAVGTTSVRTIEDYLARALPLTNEAYFGEANIFIYPPYSFLGVDALITNFHQPRSTLLCLVAAFLTPGSTDGIEFLRTVYAEAIAREYRFFSYGDAMLIV